MLNAKILKLHLGDQEELKNELKKKEIELKKCRKAMSLAASSVMKCIYIAKLAHQSCGCLKVACAIYDVDGKSIDSEYQLRAG